MRNRSLGKKAESVLLVGAVPPPFHGQAVVTNLVFEAALDTRDVSRLNLKFSDGMEEVGVFSCRKLSVLWRGVRHFVSFRGSRRRDFCVLYYCAGSANWVPLLRDVVLLGVFGRLFSRRVVHFHSGGLVEWFDCSSLAKFFGFLAYGGAERCLSLTSTVKIPCFSGSDEVIVPNGLPVPVESHPKGDCINFLYVGALRESKGVGVLLESLVHLREMLDSAGFAWKLSLVGVWVHEDERKKWLSFVAEQKLEEFVFFRGQLSGNAKWEEYQKASVFVFPSFYESENQPLVLIEAMGAGIPVISTKWRGIPELVVDGETGILVDVKSPELFAESMLEMVKDSNLRSQMGKSALSRYQSLFSLNQFERRINDAICNW